MIDDMNIVTWVLESDVFPETHASIREAVRKNGHRLVDWSDQWWSLGMPVHLLQTPLIFHGSLGNAERIARDLNWTPGSFCPLNAFCCSTWYESARPWLVHQEWVVSTARDLVSNPTKIVGPITESGKVFVRPDSPLKPFSGRVVDIDSLTLAKLDHGIYYEDESLPVVIASVQCIGREWRFVIAHQKVIAGSAYDPTTRRPIRVALDSDSAAFASDVASQLPPPADVYVLDVCECNGELRLLELNPFGGADLYACDADAIVNGVSEIASSL